MSTTAIRLVLLLALPSLAACRVGGDLLDAAAGIPASPVEVAADLTGPAPQDRGKSEAERRRQAEQEKEQAKEQEKAQEKAQEKEQEKEQERRADDPGYREERERRRERERQEREARLRDRRLQGRDRRQDERRRDQERRDQRDRRREDQDRGRDEVRRQWYQTRNQGREDSRKDEGAEPQEPRRRAGTGDPDWPRSRTQVRVQRGGRERRGDRSGDREHRHPAAFFELSWGEGDFDFQDGRGRVETGSELFRLRTGAVNRRGSGGGLDLRYYDPKHDYYEGTPGHTSVDQFDLYAFGTREVWDRADRFRMPVRFGPYYDLLLVKENAVDDYRNFHSLGLRIEVEPEITLIHGEGSRLAVYAGLSAGAHLTRIDDDVTGEEHDTVGTTVRFEPGIRWVRDGVELSFSYHNAETAFRKSSRENGFQVPRTETEFEGFQVSVGWRF